MNNNHIKFKSYDGIAYRLVKTNAKETDIEATINYFKKQCDTFDGDMLRASYENWLAMEDEGHITNSN